MIRGSVNFLCKCGLSQSGKRPSNWMAKRLRACFQSLMGIVHFFAACSMAKYTQPNFNLTILKGLKVESEE